MSSISRHGATLWFRVDGGTQSDLWRLPLGSGTAKAEPVLATPANEQVPSPSPDGRWLAYRTNASGRDEAVLAPMSSPVAAVQISTDGGVPLGWSGDGRRLFFRQRDEVWEVGVGPGGLVRSTARRIFTIAPWLSNIEVSLDGEHLYAIRGGMIYSDLIVKQGALR